MKRRFIKCTPITFGHGHSDLESKYNQFKNKIKENLKKVDFFQLGKIHVGFRIYIAKDRLKYGNDLDNFAKPVVDAIDEARIIKDENQIFSIYMEKIIVNTKDEEGIAIEIREKHEEMNDELGYLPIC